MPAWLVWLIVAAVLATAEAVTVTFFLIMLAGAAAAGAVAAALGAPLAAQVAVFAGASIGLITVVRPLAKRRLELPIGARFGMDALVGRTAVVLRTVDEHSGRVKLAGEEWSAVSYDPTQVFEIGRTVRVLEIRGAEAVVWADP